MSRRPRWWVGAAFAAFACWYVGVGLARFAMGRSGGYDLGIFSQAAQRWSMGRLPGSSLRGLDNLFADHFSPITAVFGLGWRVWPDPRVLIIVQGLALAGAVAVLAGAAVGRVPGLVAAGLVLAMGLAKGSVSAAVFDVHEAAFGALLISGVCRGLLASNRRALLLCSAGLLLVKEDLGLTVLAIAAVWWWRERDRRTALIVAGMGVVGGLVATAVVAWSNPDHRSPYLQFFLGSSGNPQGIAGGQVHGANRWAPLLLFVGTAGLIGLRSSIAWLAVPTLAWRFASSNESYWETYFHYDAILVPVAAFALLEVLATRRVSRVQVAAVVLGLGLAAGSGVAKAAEWRPWRPDSYRLSARLVDARWLARVVPDGEAVVAQQDLAPILLSRLDVHLLSDAVQARARWVLLTEGGSEFGAPEAAKRAWLDAVRSLPGVQVSARGAVLLVRLPPATSVRLPG